MPNSAAACMMRTAISPRLATSRCFMAARRCGGRADRSELVQTCPLRSPSGISDAARGVVGATQLPPAALRRRQEVRKRTEAALLVELAHRRFLFVALRRLLRIAL